MCKQNMILVCIFAITRICLTDSATPPYLTKCKAEDSNCLLKTSKAVIPIFASGIPKLKVPSSDPLYIKSINASQGNLLFVITDATIAGLKNCEPMKVARDADKSKIFISMLCTATLDGMYELKGNVLVLQIEGKGKIHADLNGCLVNAEADIVHKDGEDGKKHWSIKTWKNNFELKEKSKINFENLYEDNPVLARASRDLFENNGNDIIREIGPDVIKTILGKVLKNVNAFFKAYSVEDLSLN